MNLYTKNGRPLQMRGDSLYSKSGTYLGQIQGSKVFDPSGRYAGSIVGDRVVYRIWESAALSSPSVAAPVIGTITVNAIPAAILGDEPNFPE